MTDDPLVTTATAARRIGVTPGRVRQLADAGRLANERTIEGVRLFRTSEVERFADARAARLRTLSISVQRATHGSLR